MIYDSLAPQHRTASLLKASPKGEGFQPSPSGTLKYLSTVICPFRWRELPKADALPKRFRRETTTGGTRGRSRAEARAPRASAADRGKARRGPSRGVSPEPTQSSGAPRCPIRRRPARESRGG